MWGVNSVWPSGRGVFSTPVWGVRMESGGFHGGEGKRCHGDLIPRVYSSTYFFLFKIPLLMTATQMVSLQGLPLSPIMGCV